MEMGDEGVGGGRSGGREKSGRKNVLGENWCYMVGESTPSSLTGLFNKGYWMIKNIYIDETDNRLIEDCNVNSDEYVFGRVMYFRN